MLSTEEKVTSIKEENRLLTVKEAAESINESPGVVRNWLRELKALIPVVIGDNGYRYFNQDSIDMLLKVKELRNNKQLSLKQIEDELTSSISLTSSPLAPPLSLKSDATEKILEDLKSIKDALELQKNFNQVLVQQLKKQQEHIERQHQQIIEQKQHIVTLESNSSKPPMELRLEEKTREPVEVTQSKQKKNHFFRLLSYR
ncbi:MAG TPA: MerR family transcriptional regulator [Niallia sp.]|nr:MerR family transcriptional regulator [Niallia sp.]